MTRRWMALMVGVSISAACGGSSTAPPRADPPHDHGAHEHAHERPPTAPTGPVVAPEAPTADAGPVAASPNELLAAERAAFERAQPAFQKRCVSCHTRPKGTRSTLEHFEMTSYPFGGHHADDVGAMVRASLGASGKKATMPKNAPGTVPQDELALMLAWADAFDRAKAAGAHQPAPTRGHKH